MQKAIMAIGAHADDVEIRSGGTLAKYHRMGYEVVCVLATNNTAGAHTSQTALEHATQRRSEAREGARILNAELIYLDFKETMFEKRGERERLGFQTVDLSDYPEWGRDRPPIVCAQDLDEAVEEVAALLRLYEPEIVLTHSPTEKHEHWSTCVLVLKAFKKARQRVELGTLYAWADSGTATVSIAPDFFVDITDTIQTKYTALSKHVSQGFREIPDPPNRARELYWGSFIGVQFAEAFMTLARGGEL
jgi:LmbE family N-acetylglucosaminyl deacetylase